MQRHQNTFLNDKSKAEKILIFIYNNTNRISLVKVQKSFECHLLKI